MVKLRFTVEHSSSRVRALNHSSLNSNRNLTRRKRRGSWWSRQCLSPVCTIPWLPFVQWPQSSLLGATQPPRSPSFLPYRWDLLHLQGSNCLQRNSPPSCLFCQTLSVGTSVPLTSSVPCPLPSHVSCPKVLLTLPSQCICHFGISGATIPVQVSLHVCLLQHPPEGLLLFSHFSRPHTLPQDSFCYLLLDK